MSVSYTGIYSFLVPGVNEALGNYRNAINVLLWINTLFFTVGCICVYWKSDVMSSTA